MKRMLTTQQWYCMLHHDIYITGEQNLTHVTEHLVLMDKKHIYVLDKVGFLKANIFNTFKI